ncbi:hypothetical protein EDD22DRAFT_1022669 [Suillus occidentalis]|nr:hypothetical protein EDD22DRAFT_1022669 [Suillus occidentalis]
MSSSFRCYCLGERRVLEHIRKDEVKSPRGVRGFMLNTGEFGEWKFQGNFGGYTKCTSEGLPNATAGVGFFVTTFNLSIPDGFDVPMSFTFDDFSQSYRSQLYVNGWMMGKRVSNLGLQYQFPVYQGILGYNVSSTLTIITPAPSLGILLQTVLALTCSPFVSMPYQYIPSDQARHLFQRHSCFYEIVGRTF